MWQLVPGLLRVDDACVALYAATDSHVLNPASIALTAFSDTVPAALSIATTGPVLAASISLLGQPAVAPPTSTPPTSSAAKSTSITSSPASSTSTTSTATRKLIPLLPLCVPLCHRNQLVWNILFEREER